LRQIRSYKDPVHERILVIAYKQKRLFEGYFLQIGIKDTSEIHPENKGGDDKKKKPVKHDFLLNSDCEGRNLNCLSHRY